VTLLDRQDHLSQQRVVELVVDYFVPGDVSSEKLVTDLDHQRHGNVPHPQNLRQVLIKLHSHLELFLKGRDSLYARHELNTDEKDSLEVTVARTIELFSKLIGYNCGSRQKLAKAVGLMSQDPCIAEVGQTDL
jgi:hypothetical protein